jgi:hypothetical protein
MRLRHDFVSIPDIGFEIEAALQSQQLTNYLSFLLARKNPMLTKRASAQC